MIEGLEFKKLIYDQLLQVIQAKVESSTRALLSLKESRNSATKSSAGDKHETGRAMMQLEFDKLDVQLKHAINQKKEIEKINPGIIHDKVEFGSLVLTNHGNYFISIGLGNMESEGLKYFAISLASPVGQLLNNKKAADSIYFRGIEIQIADIF